MPDLDKLRSLGDQIRPPALALLEETARRRDRRAAVTTVGSGLAAALVAIAGVVALQSVGDDRARPDPITPVSPTPTPDRSPTPTPTVEAEPTHQSETSMTPREVMQASNAQFLFGGVSADDPDFAVSVWTAECAWCPPEYEDPPTQPTFNALAVTTDGWRTATYRRPPMGAGRPFRVLSPAPGVLLVSDFSNGGEWLVREDGSVTEVERVVEDRLAEEPREWFECLSTEVARPDYLSTWCALDPDTATAYEWRDPWSQDPGLVGSAVNPGTGLEPWGRALMSVDGDRELMAWFYLDGERRTRLLASGPVGSGFQGFTGDMVLGATEDLLYWSHVRGTDELTFHVGDDGGAEWRDIVQTMPSSEVSTEELMATPEGAVLLRHVTEHGDYLQARIWRLESLEAGTWELVHDTGEVPYQYDLGEMHPLTVVGSRIVLGALRSDDDGRSWTQVDRWR